MKRGRVLTVALAVAILVMFVVPLTVRAQQGKVIELTYGSAMGPDHTFSKADKEWFDKIEKETNGRVKFKPFWGGTVLGMTAQSIDEVRQGAVDIGLISAGMAKTGYDITKDSYIFFSGARLRDGYRIFMEILKKYPEIEQEYKGLKVLAWNSGIEYQLITRKPVRRLADLKGMRIKTNGETIDVLKALGAEGVIMSMSDTYMGLQGKILDGAFVPASTLSSMHFAEAVKYMTYFNHYRAHTGSRVMNLNTWNKLPPDIQKVFENNIPWLSVEGDKFFIQEDEDGKAFGKKKGMEFIDLPKEDLAAWYGLVLKEAVKEAAQLDAKGLPGTKILNDAQRLIKASQK